MTDHWQAVALSRDLGRRPLRLMFEGAPVVLFRTGDGIAALYDRCPHRQVPLSGGRVIGQEIECPYHGWRFDGEGLCTAVPGHLGPPPRVKVARFAAAEAHGAIFLSRSGAGPVPDPHPLAGGRIVQRVVRSTAQSTLLDVAENILDATHTHYTHKGLLRGLSSRRHAVAVRITGGPDHVEAVYTGEDRQEGLISRMLEGGRTKTVGRFRAPGIAELEYWGPDGMVLTTSFHLRQSAPGTVDGIGWLAGPLNGPLDRLKALAFVPLFRIALRQDQRVLAASSENARHAPERPPVLGPLDFLRADIARICAGEPPLAATAPQDHVIEL